MKKKIIGNKILWGILSTAFTATFVGLVIGTSYAWKYERMVNTYLDISETDSQNNTNGQYYTSDYDNPDDLLSYEKELCAEIEGEGATLLKNDNNALPLASRSKVSLFSRSSTDLVYGGTGSGSVSSSSAVNLRDALEINNIRVNKDLWDKYKDMDTERPSFGIDSADLTKVSIAENNDGIFNSGSIIRSFQEYNDAAIIVLSRTGGEGYDLPQGNFDIQSDNTYKGKDGYFALQDDEKAMIRNVKKYFTKVIVLVNSSNALELNWINDPELSVDACLWMGSVGQTGIKGVASIIAGTTNPSGHLADTYAADSHSAPSMMNNSNMLFEGTSFNGEYDCRNNYMVYSEGIYVGYRYYETRYEDTVLNRYNAASTAGTYYSSNAWNYDEEVSFPFGFGLSYTTFEQSLVGADLNLGNNTINLKVKVKNTGNVAGKEVVQAYFQSDYTDYDRANKVEKPAVELCGFAKTNVLDPNQEQIVEINVNLDEVASYDYINKKTYFLDKGTHYIAIGNDAHDALNNILAQKGKNKSNSIMTKDGDASKAKAINIQNEILFDKSSKTGYNVTNQFDNADANYYYDDKITYLSRSDWENTYPKAYTNLAYLDSIQHATTSNVEYSGKQISEDVVTNAKNGLKLIDLKDKDYDDEEWNELIDQLSVEEISSLIGVGGFGTSSIESIIYPGTKDQDGPAGISGAFYGGKSGMSYPSEVVLASTWNLDLLEKMGKCIGEDALATNTVGWYAPGLNTHRSPYGGRNYEYFSEDGFLAGKLSAREIQGVKSKGVVVYAKHFALNDQELHRHGICIFSNEQAIREVYLKSFQYAVEDGGANGIMSSFNRIGCTWSGAHKGLLTEVLRNEWGFKGCVVTDYATSSDWMPLTAGLEAGNNLWLYTQEGMYDAKFTDLVASDKYLLQLGKNSCHDILYSYVNSAAMNGYTSDVENLNKTLPWWKPTIIAIDVFTGVLAAASITMLILKIFEKKGEKDEREKA
ncbi:MAG: glycoside hydrolase family 3 N-terminal domain-containing protein [Bacilli bacterium]|nr:glycoside hydrolase family 3 N-terminal domain-containing protein [Bacilli bacterium]